MGAGLGSSAAFAVALVRALDALFGLALDDLAIVHVAHAAETEFAGAHAGLMDQLAAIYGRRREALLIDLRDLSRRVVPLPRNMELAVIDSGTRHEHATGGYNRRRAECEEAARHLGIASLRELEDRVLDDVLERLPPPLDRRVRHVVTENARVLDSAAALRTGDIARFGKRMAESHCSLRDLYEVSCRELDLMVDLAYQQKGVYGARMTGGGFGGATINLVDARYAGQFKEKMAKSYQKETGLVPQIYICKPAEGAGPFGSSDL